MTKPITVFFFIFCWSFRHGNSTERHCIAKSSNEKDDPFHSCEIPGDFLVAGLFPMRQYTDDDGKFVNYEKCDGKLTDIYVLQSEAFLYHLNNASRILHDKYGFTLGTHLIDSCRSSVIGFRRSVPFVQGDADFCHAGQHHNFTKNAPILIMGGSSETARYVNRLLEVYCIPFLSTEATSSEFSDTHSNPYFLRVVPPDSDQVAALSALLRKFHWNHVGVIYEDTAYSHHFVQDLYSNLNCSHAKIDEARRNLTLNGTYSQENWTVCIEWSLEVSVSSSSKEWKPSLQKYLEDDKSPKVLVVIMDIIRSQDLFIEMKKMSLKKSFQLVSVDGWTSQIYEPYEIVGHAIGTEPLIEPETDEFEKYLQSVTIEQAISPWLKELIASDHSCCIPESCNRTNLTECSSNLKLNPDHIKPIGLRYSERARLGVKLLQETLERLYEDKCLHSNNTNNTICTEMASINGEILMQRLLNHSLFENGTNSGLGKYSYFYLDKKGSNWTEIGHIFSSNNVPVINRTVEEKLNLTSRVQYVANYTKHCFPKCPLGYPVVGWSGSCCWSCHFCNFSSQEYINIIIKSPSVNASLLDIVSCGDCAPPMWPNKLTHRECVQAPVSFMEWDDVTVYIPVALAVVGLLASVGCFSVVLWNYSTPLVRTSGFAYLVGLCIGSALTALLVLIPLGIRIFPSTAACIPTWVVISVILGAGQTVLLLKARHLIHEWFSTCPQVFHLGMFWATSEFLTVVCCIVTQLAFILLWVFMSLPTKPIYFGNPMKEGFIEVCSSLVSRDSIILLIQPAFQALMTIATLLKFQRHIDTHFKLLEYRYLILSAVLSGILLLVIILPDIVVAEFEQHKFVHWKLGCIAGGIAGLSIVGLLLVIRLTWMMVFNSANNDDAYIRKELSTTRDAIEKFKIDQRDLIFNRAGVQGDGDAIMIGEGHFASVLKGTLKIQSTTKLVAIKKLKENAISPWEEKKFYEEAFYMSHLRGHKNIVWFYGTCQTDTAHLLVMEYLDGGSLEEYLQAQEGYPLGVTSLIGFCKDVSQACSFMESKKIIHRDIKAENCLMKKLGEGARGLHFIIKLSDFGLARDVHSNSSYKVSTFTLAPIRHRAPESFNSEFTTKSDVWAFGVLIWQIFHYAALPLNMFKDREMYVVVCLRKQTVLDHLHTNNSRIEAPPALQQIIESCLQYEQTPRPSFKELQKTLGEMHSQWSRGIAGQVPVVVHNPPRRNSAANCTPRNYSIFSQAY